MKEASISVGADQHHTPLQKAHSLNHAQLKQYFFFVYYI